MGLFSKKENKQDQNQEAQSRFRKIDDQTYVDNETGEVISTYLPGRRARMIGKSILRLGKWKLFLLSALLIVAILFILAFMQEKTGNFTINLDRLELFRKGISMSDDPWFTNPTSRLSAKPIEKATNISGEDLPSNINYVDGDHSGKEYMAYTYYVRNAGKEDVAYRAIVTLDSATKGAEEACRVAVWKNDEEEVYAMPAADGEPEPGCISFISPEIVCEYDDDNFRVGDVDKFTVVIWLEGDDPECVDKIIGGGLEFSMRLAAVDEEDSSLLDKFVEDIKDTISGDNPIGAAGTESPDYSQYKDVNWFTRKNKDEGNN